MMIPFNAHYSYIDDDGILWIEFAACRYCHCWVCNSLSAQILGGRELQCNGCGQMIRLFDDTYFAWTDDPPPPQVTHVKLP